MSACPNWTMGPYVCMSKLDNGTICMHVQTGQWDHMYACPNWTMGPYVCMSKLDNGTICMHVQAHQWESKKLRALPNTHAMPAFGVELRCRAAKTVPICHKL
jgi:hypothetical protein